MVFIASKLKLPIEAHVEQFILEAAHVRWHKKGFFSWFMGPTEQQEECNDTGTPTSSEAEDEYDDTDSNSSIEHEEPEFSVALLQAALDNLLDLNLAKSSEGCISSSPTQQLQESQTSDRSQALVTQKTRPHDPDHESSSANELSASFEFPKVISVFRNLLI
jgi:hypothetical protein